MPVIVTWYGAIAFAQNYGYDLPTDAEWEKAARGPGHDGLGEHQIYPWGNSINGSDANYSGSGDTYEPGLTPVGRLPLPNVFHCQNDAPTLKE
ncbi:MAG: SUMF1/EgtB/PvdO family nonheme iron enzyme [Chloroflexi bacterium]|nr:SUMF1/EgtB/PvdO family nonheme iron enzyme [Chloroflexota bacterium]